MSNKNCLKIGIAFLRSGPSLGGSNGSFSTTGPGFDSQEVQFEEQKLLLGKFRLGKS